MNISTTIPGQLSDSQQQLLLRLKHRGAQPVKILARQLEMTGMGVRQHLRQLQALGLVEQTAAQRQTRGRPVHLWNLTEAGNRRFADGHRQLSVDLLQLISSTAGEQVLEQILDRRQQNLLEAYANALATDPAKLGQRVEQLAQLRDQEGYMAEVRLLPGAWLLSQNHCPIAAAAGQCSQLCAKELQMFRELLGDGVEVERTDHRLAGARRCAFKITPRARADSP